MLSLLLAILVVLAVLVGVLLCRHLCRRPRAGPSLPVVPGGEGFGMTTRAAYGGTSPPQILRVSSLTDSGTGTLRDALVASGPRVVVFETSGTIWLTQDIVVNQPYLTVAGATAPSPGITIAGFGILVMTHDVLLSHLRCRPGDGPPRIPQTQDHDGLIAYNCGAVVFDHCSVSWAQDKNMETFSALSGAGVTYWRCLLSEALYHAKNVIVDAGQPSALGLLLTQWYAEASASSSVLGCLLAHNSDRNPEIQGPVNVHFINNVVYDWGKDETNYQWATFLAAYGPSIPHAPKLACIGNVYLAGPPPYPFTPLYAGGEWNCVEGTEVYWADNQLQGCAAYDAHGGDHRVAASPVDLTGITVRPAAEVEAFVLANAGARPADRDAVDLRVVQQVRSRTGGRIASQDEVGGWPSLAINRRTLAVPANPHTVTASGYTTLEVWLHGYARLVEGVPAPEPPPVVTAQETIGFDYKDTDLARYGVTHFEGQWDGEPFVTIDPIVSVRPDTPAGSHTYTVVPPFTDGAHTFVVRAAPNGVSAAPFAFTVVTTTSAPVAPTHLRDLPK